MRKKIIARTAKLLSESKRSRRHQGIAIAYEHIPADLDERNHGSIYAVINVNAESEHAEEIAELIIDAFHGEFYQDLGKDPLASFESALSRVNEELAEITHQGNIHWLNKLNAVLAVFSDTAFHLTQTGKAEAFIYRNGHASNITSDLGGDSINPLRTFMNIASGELLEGDKVAIATPGVFYHISKDELQKYVEEFQPKVAISHLADLLEGNSGDIQPNSILIIEAITPEAASEETVAEIQDEVWLTESPKPVQTAIEKSAPFAQKALYYTKKFLEATAAFITLTAWPKTKALALDAKDGIAKLLAGSKTARKPQKTKDSVLSETAESITATGGKEDFEDLTINESSNELIENSHADKGNVIHIKETKNKPKWLKLEKINFSAASKAREGFGNFWNKLFGNKRSLLIVGSIVLIVLAVSIFGIFKFRENAEAQKLAEASYTEAQSKLDIAKTDLGNGNKSQAATELTEALAITNNLKKNPSLKDRASTLATEIQNQLDTAESIVRVSPNMLGSTKDITGNDAFGPFVIGKSAYLIGKNDGSIAGVSLSSGEVSNVLDKPNLSGKITAATAVTSRSVLVLFTDKNSIYEFDTKDVSLNKQSTTGAVENVAAIAAFSTNIYSIEKDTGKIYKRLKVTGGYSARSEYIVDGGNVKNSVSLAIDSSLYALTPNGSMSKYLSGKKQNYSLNDIPFSISNANSVFTNENTTGLYITDGSAQRILHFDGKGKYVSQLVSDSFKNISGAYVDDTTKIIYAFADGKLYKLNQ